MNDNHTADLNLLVVQTLPEYVSLPTPFSHLRRLIRRNGATISILFRTTKLTINNHTIP